MSRCKGKTEVLKNKGRYIVSYNIPRTSINSKACLFEKVEHIVCHPSITFLNPAQHSMDTSSKSFVIPKRAKKETTQFSTKLEKGTRDWDNVAGIIRY